MYWKVDREGCPLTESRLNFNPSAMSANDPTNCGKPEASATGPRGKEWIEDFDKIILTDTSAVIRDSNDCLTLRSHLSLTDLNCNLAVPINRINRIED